MLVLYIAVGGALGAVARYALGGWIHSWAGAGFPWGTFAVNAIGSLLIGFSVHYLDATGAAPELRAFVAAGILGAFTTFTRSPTLLQQGAWARAAAYTLGSLLVGLLSAGGGLLLGARVWPSAG